MRKLLPFTLLPLVAYACFDPANPIELPDGGPVHFDAGMLPDGSLPDVALPDAVAPEAEAGPQPVKVIVLKNNAPEQGINVVFQDATGAVTATATTDALGSASHLVDPGSMVTVAFGASTSRKLVTVTGVQPGDVLTAVDTTGASTAAVSTSVTPANPPAGTSYYTLSAGPCSYGTLPSAQPPYSFTIYPPDCVVAGKFPMLVVAEDANNLPLQYAYAKGNSAVTDAGAVAVSAFSPWSIPGSVALTINNAPSGYTNFGYSEIADGVAYPQSSQTMGTGGTVMASFATHPSYPDAVQFTTGVSGTVMSDAGFVTNQTVSAIAKRVAAPAPTTLDMAQLLPLVTAASVDSTDSAHPTAIVSFASTPTGADGILVAMSWMTFDPEAGVTNGSWEIIAAPPTTANVTLKAPSLPPSLAAWLPSMSGASFNPLSVVLADSDQIASYDQLRATIAVLPAPASLLGGPTNVPPLPTNGTLRVSGAGGAPM
jgi:hypothetical protein